MPTPELPTPDEEMDKMINSLRRVRYMINPEARFGIKGFPEADMTGKQAIELADAMVAFREAQKSGASNAVLRRLMDRLSKALEG